MARILTDGAEMNDTLFWTSPGSLTIKYDTPDPVDGDYYYRLGGGSTCSKLFPETGEIYTRLRIYLNNKDIRDGYFGVDNTTDWTNNVVSLNVNSGGEFIINICNAVQVNTHFSPNTGQWYLVELYCKVAESPNGHVTLKIDGTQIADWSGDSRGYTTDTYNRLTFSAYSVIYLDDIAMNDTTGGVDDSWCGDGSVVKVTPDGNGAHNNWHGSDLDDVDNYLLVDEYGHDGDTTYVYHDASASGTQDQYAMSDYSGAGYTITRVYAEARARLSAASDKQIKLGILPNGSTDQMSSGISLPAGAYARVVGNEYLVNPADAGAWEETDIDALEGVIEVA